MGSRRPSSRINVTERAMGRSARTTTPSGPGWAPRIECGSWYCPETSRSNSLRLVSVSVITFPGYVSAMNSRGMTSQFGRFLAS